MLGIANTNQQDPIAGEYTAKEAFAEFAVPLLQDSVIAESLTLNAAVRYSDYDLFGEDVNYKVGLDWQIVPSLKVRANYATAFRIPNIPELFGGVAEGNLTTTDPCSGWSSLPADSVVRQNCQAYGVPAGYVQPGNTILTTSGGNPDLEPEDAKSLTVGAVWTPSFLPGLTLTVDYFNIKIDNAIQRIDGSANCRSATTPRAWRIRSAAMTTSPAIRSPVKWTSCRPSRSMRPTNGYGASTWVVCTSSRLLGSIRP